MGPSAPLIDPLLCWHARLRLTGNFISTEPFIASSRERTILRTSRSFVFRTTTFDDLTFTKSSTSPLLSAYASTSPSSRHPRRFRSSENDLDRATLGRPATLVSIPCDHRERAHFGRDRRQSPFHRRGNHQLFRTQLRGITHHPVRFGPTRPCHRITSCATGWS